VTVEKQQAVLDAGERLFGAWEPLTIRGWATEAGTTSQTFYTYFGSRQLALAAVYSQMVDGVHGWVDAQRAVLAQVPTDDDPEFLVVDVLMGWREFATAFPGRRRLVLGGVGPEDSDPLPARLAVSDVVGLVVDAMKAAGLDPAAGYEATARVVLGFVTGHAAAVGAGFAEPIEARDRGIIARMLGL
jgi:AcrR family transcriptional regulator